MERKLSSVIIHMTQKSCSFYQIQGRLKSESCTLSGSHFSHTLLSVQIIGRPNLLVLDRLSFQVELLGVSHLYNDSNLGLGDET